MECSSFLPCESGKKPSSNKILSGISSVPKAFEATAYTAGHAAINSIQVVINMQKKLSRRKKSASSTRRRLLELTTALLSDALGKTGGLDHDMKCLSAKCRMAGPAATLRVHTADILMVAKAISTCPPGAVLVIDGQGELNTALWGILTTLAARLKGLEGVVIDGAVRDVEGIRRERFPVFARAVVPNAGGAEYVGEMGIPIQCGGMVVNPGDWIVGDEDGVVVVPFARVVEVVELAERVQAVERRIDAKIRRGTDLASLACVDQVLEQKSARAFLPQLRFEGR